jgi:glycerol-3-phosphate acyltransferase PlsY
MIITALIVLSYLVGSFPSALVAGRLVRGIDIRKFGSGNVGATNVFRVLGARWGLAVAVVDLAKGFLPVFFFVQWIGSSATIDPLYLQIVFGLVAILGHVFTVFGGFRGGKGVLTGLGVLFAIMPLEAGIAVLIFTIVFALFRIVSLGSLLSATGLCMVLIVEKYVMDRAVRWELLLTCVLLLILVLITHRSNISRLVAGTEPTFRKRSD